MQAALELSMSQSDASQEPVPPSLSINQSDASQEPEPLPVLTDSSIGPTPTPASAIPVLEKVDEICVIPDDVAPPSPIVPTAETGNA